MIENCGCEIINCTVNNMCDKGLMSTDPIFIFISDNIIYIFTFILAAIFIYSLSYWLKCVDGSLEEK